ncbi:MAG: zinc/manganese transport system substrate-binding protein [Frankiales bacterium]|jgi:zinc/manganese transport system substrate-binding protein|nr:zinc/manganese transport system substrate-binding protein [Frankiales bacterium]
MTRLPTTLAAIGLGALLLAAGCATSPTKAASTTGSHRLEIVAAENFWGSLAGQLGGTHAHVTSIINSPDADPHDYEPTASDGRAIAGADLAIVNGVGYDTWASKLIAANPSQARTDLTVGALVGVPTNGNPHRWYSPDDVRTVIDTLTADFNKLDPADHSYFEAQRTQVLTVSLKGYFDEIAAIKARYAGTPVGASESIFAPLAQGLGLTLLTPESFLGAISDGTDPTARDKTLIDAQITDHRIKLYVYNSQNATPDVQAQVSAARKAGIPVTTVTETLTPAGASFQDWQVRQLTSLRAALAQATGK